MLTFGDKLLIVDGGMGTMLQSAGLAPGRDPGWWNLENPDAVLAVHKAYLDAGCDCVTSNTFGVNRLSFGERAREAYVAGVRLAKRAAREHGRGLVFADIGPSGRLLKPFGDLAFEDAVSLFGDMARAGEEAGADAILLETFSDLHELKAAMLGARESTSLPVVATVMADERGRLLTGGDLWAVAALLSGMGAAAIGLNCGAGPEQMLENARILRQASALPLLCSPNAGLPEEKDGNSIYTLSPEAFAEHAERLLEAGASMLGGCCGTTPAHMQALVAACAGKPLARNAQQRRAVICSLSRTLSLDAPFLIGERINPTGKPALKQALAAGDMDYIAALGAQQQRAGAQALDVNVGMPGIDEKKALTRAVEALQETCDLPLCIDSGDPAALESALRACAGVPLINSVSGTQASLAAVLPLAKKYACALIALPMDEAGVPSTARGRLNIARRILSEAQKLGIEKEALLFDGLTMPVSAQSDAGRVTLETIELLQKELGVKTVLGLSNVSFGLPKRGVLGAAFLSLALARGLTGAIANPQDARVMEEFAACRVLLGRDRQCLAYIAACEGADAPKEEAAHDLSLADAIRDGLASQAGGITRALLQTRDALELISEEIVPALADVGARFEKGEKYLPQLLMSAEAAKAAFAEIDAVWAARGIQRETKGAIVLATVRGDVHDIGKNIVKALLQSTGYRIIDLGKDVPKETIAQAVREHGARLCGLSALMTTTLPAMREAVALLKQACPDTRVMVGGAVLTPRAANDMGADFYAADAMAAVRVADELFD